MRKLVAKVISIIKKYEEENIKNGYGNNIYSLLNMERDEVMTHEETIYSIFQNLILITKRGLKWLDRII